MSTSPKPAEKVEKKAKQTVLVGIVMSNKMTKTVVVKVDTVKVHPQYHKRIMRSKRYKVHVPDSTQYAIGQKIRFQGTRPISKDKHWIVVSSS